MARKEHISNLRKRGVIMSEKKKLLIAIPLGCILGYLFLRPSGILNIFLFIGLCLLFGGLIAGDYKKES
ncbi:MAG TPA: hypothetical protein VIG40_08630 [Tissierellaceae bacterium]